MKKDPIFLLGLMNFFSMMNLTLYRGYLAIFLSDDLIVSITIFTIVVSSINFFQLFMRVPLGALSQVIGRKPMILIGNTAIAFAMFLLYGSSILNNWIIAFLSALSLGFGMSAHWPATFSYIQDVSNGNGYGKANGRVFKIGDIGIVIGSVIAKYLLDELLISLQLFFLIFSCIGFISVLIFYIFLPESLKDSEREFTSEIFSYFFRSVMKMFYSLKNITFQPGMLKIYIFQFFLSFTEFMFTTFFPLVVIYYGYSKGTVGAILFSATVFLLWFKPYLGNISDRFGYRGPVLLSLFIISIFFLILTYVQDLFALIIIYFVVVACTFIAYPAVNSATATTSSSTQTGIALGALGVYTSIGRASSTIVLSPIWEGFSIVFVFQFTALFLLVIIAILWFFSRSVPKIKTDPQ